MMGIVYPNAPVDDKTDPRFIAGYEAGLRDGRAENSPAPKEDSLYGKVCSIEKKVASVIELLGVGGAKVDPADYFVGKRWEDLATTDPHEYVKVSRGDDD